MQKGIFVCGTVKAKRFFPAKVDATTGEKREAEFKVGIDVAGFENVVLYVPQAVGADLEVDCDYEKIGPLEVGRNGLRWLRQG